MIRKLVQQVRERLGVHEPVLDRDMRDFRGNVSERSIDPRPDTSDICEHLIDCRPIGWRIVGQLSGWRVDPELEEFVEGRVTRLH